VNFGAVSVMLCWFQLCQGDCAFALILLRIQLSVSITALLVMAGFSWNC